MPAAQRFTPEHLFNARVESAGEDATMPSRVMDGTAKFNMGLPGVDTVVGKNADGSARLAYRPLSHAEVGSNRNAAEIAKRNNLVPMGKAYRAIGSK